jgi:AraC-like DNA-binding protein
MVPATTLHAVLRGFSAVGLDAAALARAVGVPADLPRDPFAVVPDGAFGRLWRAALEADPRPHLPALVGAAVPFGAFGLTDHLVGSAPTLGAALQALAGYFRLVSPVSRLDVEPEHVWVHNEAPSPATAVSDMFTLAVTAARFRPQLPSGAPREVQLTYPDVVPVAPFEQAFGAPVHLGRPRSGLALPPDTWDAPLTRPDPALHATLEALAGRVDVRTYSARPVAYAVRLRLPDALREGRAGAPAMARSLYLSLRTFQRRLAAEGTRYEELVDTYRREESAQLLDGVASVGDVAARLGYAEPTSFTRAFRRWYGVPPSRREQ